MATETKVLLEHTPGPWSVEPVMGDEDLSIILDYKVEGEGYPIVVANTLYHDLDRTPFINRKQHEANARLIAAAPALYEALSGLRDVIRESETSEAIRFEVKDLPLEIWIDGVIEKAREALALVENY